MVLNPAQASVGYVSRKKSQHDIKVCDWCHCTAKWYFLGRVIKQLCLSHSCSVAVPPKNYKIKIREIKEEQSKLDEARGNYEKLKSRRSRSIWAPIGLESKALLSTVWVIMSVVEVRCEAPRTPPRKIVQRWAVPCTFLCCESSEEGPVFQNVIQSLWPNRQRSNQSEGTLGRRGRYSWFRHCFWKEGRRTSWEIQACDVSHSWSMTRNGSDLVCVHTICAVKYALQESSRNRDHTFKQANNPPLKKMSYEEVYYEKKKKKETAKHQITEKPCLGEAE